MTPRRKFLIGISAAVVSAPAIVRVGSLMPVRGIVMPVHKNYYQHYGFCDRLWLNGVMKVENCEVPPYCE